VRALVYVVGASVDGFIAGPAGEVDFYPVTDDVVALLAGELADTLPAHVRAQLGVPGAPRRFDTVLMGRATYEPALAVGITSPYAPLRQLVVSRTLDDAPDPEVEIVRGDPVAVVRALKAEPGGDILLVGGGQLAGALLGEVDELVVKVYPVLAGAGVPLFTAPFTPTALTLTGSRVLERGTVVLTYAVQHPGTTNGTPVPGVSC
jgi:dihydrofolate reductase